MKMPDDYFRGPGPAQAAMRALLEREASARARRFGLERRAFLGSTLGALAASAVWQQMPRFQSSAEAQDGFVPPSEECYEEALAQHATSRTERDATAQDGQIIQAAAIVQQAAVPETVINMLRALATLYAGFGVNQLVHGTQTATRAVRDDASDELVLASLIHDIGETISGINHAEIAAALVRPYVSDATYRLVRHHAEFQLKHYGDKVLQPVDMRERYRGEPWYEQTAIMSDAWDQTSFDPDYDTLPLAEFEPLVHEFFSRVPPHQHRTALDCA